MEERIVSFPRMGIYSDLMKDMMSELDIEVRLPPPTSESTIKWGCRYSSDMFCFPFKSTLGNFKEALDNGANTLLMWDNKGTCRERHYWILQEFTLRKQGYSDFEMIPVNGNLPFVIKKLNPKLSYFRIIKTLYSYLKKVKEIEKQELTEGINIGIIGEIYSCLEPSMNYDIERKLKAYGVNPYNTIRLAKFVKERFLPSNKNKYIKKAEKYLNGSLGGHGVQNIGNVLWMIDNGVKGVIHILPLSCMPENSVEVVIDSICKDNGLPILRLPIDETSAEANVDTRIEAFIELIKMRQNHEGRVWVSKNHTGTGAYLGCDVGSVSVKLVVIDNNTNVLAKIYLKNNGIIETLKKGMAEIHKQLDDDVEIKAVGVTGSGREFTKILIGADVKRTEILAHTIATMDFLPNAQTIFDIGGQDSKIITLSDGVWRGYIMNSICGAGTGSMIESIARTLNVDIKDVGDIVLGSDMNLSFPGKCGILCESAVISRKNKGAKNKDILMGVCRALINNYLSMAKSIDINPPYVFQGATAKNKGLIRALEEQLKHKVTIPPDCELMGAKGMALIARDEEIVKTEFKGFDIKDLNISAETFVCEDCPNKCEITKIIRGDEIVDHLGSKCGKY